MILNGGVVKNKNKNDNNKKKSKKDKLDEVINKKK
jgi:hypothetical protein